MSSTKLTPAATNIRNTYRGGMRTGRQDERPAVSPVTVYQGPGPTSLPHTLDKLAPPVHPAPSTAVPAAAKCAAIKAALAAKALAQFKRNITTRANKLRALGAKGWPSFAEFVLLEGDGPYDAKRCAEYLSTFPLPRKAKA